MPLPLLQVFQVEVPVDQLCQVVVLLLLAAPLQRHRLLALSSLVKRDARSVDLSVPSPLVSWPCLFNRVFGLHSMREFLKTE